MKNHLPLHSSLVFAAGLVLTSCNQQTDVPPNFIIIQYDDLGWDDLGYHGNMLIETPRIDAFAESATRFNQFYVNSVCAPTRASLLTGRFFLRTGVSHVHGGKDYLSVDERTFADLLGEHGYATGMWGKWHSGTGNRYYPWQRGFDVAYMAQLYTHENSVGLLNGEPVESGKWADETIIDQAIDFIRDNRDKPFMAYVSSLSPHTPLVAPADRVQKYLDKGLSRNLSTLYAMVDFADSQLGRLLDELEKLGLEENTVVMIMSDNGPAVNTDILSDEDRQIRYVNKYKGHKGDLWENGVKSPLFIRWKGKTKAVNVNTLVDVTDIFPTLLDLAGIEYQNPTKPLDGISFAETLTKSKSKTTSNRFVFNQVNPGWPPTDLPYNPEGTHNEYQPVEKELIDPRKEMISIRNHHFKLMLNTSFTGTTYLEEHEGMVLVDMIEDPKESRNIVAEAPEIAHTLANELLEWYQSVIHEEAAFAPTITYLQATQRNRIPAIAMQSLSPELKNTVHYVSGWGATGGQLTYYVHSDSKASYKIEVASEGIEGIPFGLTARTPFSEVFGTLQAGIESLAQTIVLEEGMNQITVELTPVQGKTFPVQRLTALYLYP